ncbi:MAG: peptide deformylase, partial [Akkermansiaceae bacterium]|nr:peptide deformylase [Akkermansiaceae bacterium]
LVIETDGLLARALQHEIDHLNGVLFEIDCLLSPRFR